jgi:hypothetical protein
MTALIRAIRFLSGCKLACGITRSLQPALDLQLQLPIFEGLLLLMRFLLIGLNTHAYSSLPRI